MKTPVDLEKMKSQSCPPFQNAYVFFMNRLEDNYISKLNGKERIKQELSDWDSEARKQIIDILIERLSRELQDFDPTDLLDLL